MAKIAFKSAVQAAASMVAQVAVPLDFIKVDEKGIAVLHYGDKTEVIEGFNPAWTRFSIYPDTLTTVDAKNKVIPLKPYGDNVAYFRQTERPDIYRLDSVPRPRVDLSTMTDEQFVAYSQQRAQGRRAYFQRSGRRPRTPMIDRVF